MTGTSPAPDLAQTQAPALLRHGTSPIQTTEFPMMLSDDVHSAQLRYDYSDATRQWMTQSMRLPEKLQGAVILRQIDFMAGRLCAVQALRAAGLGAMADIPVGERGAPAWPLGYVGAITHCDGWAIAIAGHGESIDALGIDMEKELSPDLVQAIHGLVAHGGELHLGQQHRMSPEGWLTILFSAKESLFKALYSDVGRYFDFLDAAAESLDTKNGVLTLGLVDTLSAKHLQGMRYPVRFQWLGNRVVTSCILRRSARTSIDTVVA